MCKTDFDFTPSGLQGKLREYLDKLDYFLFNERDLQVYLAVCLNKEEGIKVHTEYHLPRGINPKFDMEYAIWDTETPSIDIVIEKEGKFLAIELKYKLEGVESAISRFGIEKEKVAIVTDQSAENEARYDFWKDVKRIELLSEHYGNVLGGVSLFLTNHDLYLKTKEGCKYSNFGLEGTKIGLLEWVYRPGVEKIPGENYKYHIVTGPDGMKKRVKKEVTDKNLRQWIGDYYYQRPNFKLNKSYEGEWLYDKESPKEILIGKDTHDFYCYNAVIKK